MDDTLLSLLKAVDTPTVCNAMPGGWYPRNADCEKSHPR